MTRSRKTFLKSARKSLRRTADQFSTPRKMTGLFSQLTDEQKQMALNYKGPANHGDPAFLIKNTRAGSR